VTLAVLHGRNNFAGGMELARKLMARHPHVTAIFAGRDAMAFGAMRALIEAGRRIPRDISVIGFDNHENQSA
jgi:LacI family transcriptional regulator